MNNSYSFHWIIMNNNALLPHDAVWLKSRSVMNSFFLFRSSLILPTRSPRSLGSIPQKWMCNYEKATKATADPTHQDGTGMEGSTSGVCQPRLELQQRVNGFTGTCWPPDGLADGLKFVFLSLLMTGLSQSTDGSSRNGGTLPAEESVMAVLTDAARADTNACTPTHSQNASLIFIHHVSSFSQPDCQSRTVKVIHLTPALLEYVIGLCRLLFCWYVQLTRRKKGPLLASKRSHTHKHL